MSNRLNHPSTKPLHVETVIDRRATTSRNDDNSREFWDTVQSTLGQPAPRAIWILLAALGICAALITSAAAFATVYFL